MGNNSGCKYPHCSALTEPTWRKVDTTRRKPGSLCMPQVLEACSPVGALLTLGLLFIADMVDPFVIFSILLQKRLQVCCGLVAHFLQEWKLQLKMDRKLIKADNIQLLIVGRYLGGARAGFFHAGQGLCSACPHEKACWVEKRYQIFSPP